jgi:hypothetical protein
MQIRPICRPPRRTRGDREALGERPVEHQRVWSLTRLASATAFRDPGARLIPNRYCEHRESRTNALVQIAAKSLSLMI